mgnify:CR=1 FL=1
MGAVTIATNMAGRGTDILLGGNPDELVRERLEHEGLTMEDVTPEQLEQFNAEANGRPARPSASACLPPAA